MKDQHGIQNTNPNLNEMFTWIELDKIKINPNQIRKQYNMLDILALAEDIRQRRAILPETHGLIHVIVVNKIIAADGTITYKSTDGGMRLQATQKNHELYPDEGWHMMPVRLTKELNDESVNQIMLSGNLTHVPLSIMDIAENMAVQKEKFNKTDAQLAEEYGYKNRQNATQIQTLCLLPEEIKNYIRIGYTFNNETRILGQKNALQLVRLIKLDPIELKSICESLAQSSLESNWSYAQLKYEVEKEIKKYWEDKRNETQKILRNIDDRIKKTINAKLTDIIHAEDGENLITTIKQTQDFINRANELLTSLEQITIF